MSRRSWISWMGQAGALSLAGLALRCTPDGSSDLGGGAGQPLGGGDASGTTGTTDATDGQSTDSAAPAEAGGLGEDVTAATDAGATLDTGDPAGADAGPPTSIAFAPTSDADTTIKPWGENTVDPQDAEAIIATWSLRVDGMVETPIELSFADLIALLRQDQVTDFHCVEGWSVYDIPWNGVHMSTLFDLAKPLAGATHVTFHCVQAPNGKKYDESLPLDIALEPKTMLAYGADDFSLPLRHGFPLRLVIPRLLGYKNAKTIERIELTDHPVDGFWVELGYPYDAEVPPERLRPGKY